jgi:hypothetical protein
MAENMSPIIIGRSSSHFTRVVRLFASELRVECSFQVVTDLMSFDAAEYGGNPGLRLPTLRTQEGVWFGALNICRELQRRSSVTLSVVWPEALDRPLLANMQELVVQAMATEVSLIMAGPAGQSEGRDHRAKLQKSLLDTVAWLELNATDALAALPARDLSYLEVTLFCLMTHLDFRKVLPIASYAALCDFCQSFGARASAEKTTYRFDA